jgi:hypothetical protein
MATVAIKLTSKFIDVGFQNPLGSFYGYQTGTASNNFGQMSESANGTANNTTTNITGSTYTIERAYWQDYITNNHFYVVNGTQSNSGWTQLNVDGDTWSRSTATYSTTAISGKTRWYWPSNTNSYGTTTGADIPWNVEILLDDGVNTALSTTSLTATETTTVVATLSNAVATKYRIIKVSGTTPSVADGGTINSRTNNGTINIPTSGLPTAGNTATYQVQVGGPNSQTSDDDCWVDASGTNNSFTITRASGTSTYSINAPASINEGSAGTINVTTTNVSNGTTLYWDLDQTGDYATTEGTVSINSNAGSFTITPTADSTTEGAETDTVRLYSDSGRTTEVANDTFTINDTSTGSGGSSGGGDGTGTYGLEVYGPDGSTLVFGSNLRQINAVLLATTTLASLASVTYTGIAFATDASRIAVVVSKDSPSNSTSGGVSIARSTASGGSITITNASTTSQTIKVAIWRIA